MVLAGACLGFLPHNFNPARIFMGDSGSMLIGLMLAAATISASGDRRDARHAGTDVLALFAPLLAGAAVAFVPLLDLLMAVVRRTRAGTSPFSPGQDAPAPPAAGDRAQPPAGGAADLPVGRLLAYGAVALALVADRFLVLSAVGIGLVVAVLASAVPATAGRPR